jgi:hypothetical protein
MDFPFPWIQVSDGSLLLMIREYEHPFIALTYYVKELDEVIRQLEEKGINFIHRPEPSDAVRRFTFQSPDDLYISLIGIPNIEKMQRPNALTMLNFPQSDYFSPEKYPNTRIGLFGEFSHPVKELSASLHFWKGIGFKVLSEFVTPYPWAIVSDGLSIIGLHQSQHFSAPAITYFAADMKARIERLKEEGLDSIKELGSESSVMVKTPEGQQVFLFALGV